MNMFEPPPSHVVGQLGERAMHELPQWDSISTPCRCRVVMVSATDLKAALARPRWLARPNQVMDPAARYRHELRLPRAGSGPPKPIRCRRTDREEIGGYGFAAQNAHY
jgi:hypothetical protein